MQNPHMTKQAPSLLFFRGKKRQVLFVCMYVCMYLDKLKQKFYCRSCITVMPEGRRDGRPTTNIRTHDHTTRKTRNGRAELVSASQRRSDVYSFSPGQKKQFSCPLHSTWDSQNSYSQSLVIQVPAFSTKLACHIIKVLTLMSVFYSLPYAWPWAQQKHTPVS